MTLNQIRYFCAAARYHSITKAAQALFVTQPTVSIAIRELEKEFSITLFNNTKNVLSLTQEGEAFYERVSGILESCESLQAEYTNLAHLKSKVRIGIPPMLSLVFFPELLDAFHAEHPDIWLELQEYGSVRCGAMVLDEIIDIGLINMEIHNIDKFNAHLISSEELLFCVCPNHPLAGEKSIDVRHLDNQNIILFNQDSVQNRILGQRFDAQEVKPKIIMHSSQLLTTLKFLRQGQSGCFLFKSMLPMIPEVVSIPFDPPVHARVGLIWKQGRYMNKGMHAFIDFCKAYYGGKRE